MKNKLLLLILGLSCIGWTYSGTWKNNSPLEVDALYVGTGPTYSDGFIYGNGSQLTGIVSASGWTDGGTSIYTTTDGDNVGIGSTSPRSELDVDGSVYVSGTVTANNFAASGTADPQIYSTTGYISFGEVGSSNILLASVADSTGSLVVDMSDTIDTTIYNNSGGSLILGNSGNEEIVIDGTLYAGGLTAQALTQFISVKASGNSQSPFAVYNSSEKKVFDLQTDGSGNGLFYLRNSAGTAKVQFHSSSSSYFSGGNVGIGTSAPKQLLHVAAPARGANIFVDGGIYLQSPDLSWSWCSVSNADAIICIPAP
jgi:hypothetical protein